MHITLIEPFFSGSHRRWAEEFREHSRHEVQILSLQGRHWKWRMFGGAVSLAKMFNEQIEKTDLILATDMLDVSTFAGLIRKNRNVVPFAVYFHENQLTYPWSPEDEDVKKGRHNEYAFINYTSAMVADKIFFNSKYHYDSFLNSLPEFLKQFPDHQELQNVDIIRKKSEILYLGMSLGKFDKYTIKNIPEGPPIILWNHRWEYDKNPDLFFNLLFELKKEKIDFRLVVLGERYSKCPEIFNEAEKKLKKEILHFGYADSFEEYAQWIKTCDILPVASFQDFFGGSIVEAIYSGVTPLLPNRLSYPEHLPSGIHSEFIYHSEKELKNKLKSILKNNKKTDFKKHVVKYNWKKIIHEYDLLFEDMVLIQK